jgi:ribosome biogenesis GTPase
LLPLKCQNYNSTLHLDELGWSAHFASAFEPFRGPGVEPARVSLEHTHIYRVLTAEGERLARVAGRLRHAARVARRLPAVGDWVAIETPEGGGDARIRAVLPRISRFSRRAAGNPTEEQVVAANVDVVFLVSGLDGDFNPRRIERYLVTAWESGASPVILSQQGRPRRGPRRHRSRRRSAGPGRARARDVRQRARDDRSRARARRRGPHGGAARHVGRGEVVDRERAPRRRAPAHAGRREHDSRGRHTTSGRQLLLCLEAGS